MKKFLYAFFMWFIRLTWGIVDTLVGFLCFLVLIWLKPEIHMIANTIVVQIPYKQGRSGWGFASGLFIFSNHPRIWVKDSFFQHEFGHSWPQLLLMGPLHPFLVSIPSMIRFWYRNVTKNFLRPYDAAWFEGTATRWGAKWYQYGIKQGLWA